MLPRSSEWAPRAHFEGLAPCGTSPVFFNPFSPSPSPSMDCPGRLKQTVTLEIVFPSARNVALRCAWAHEHPENSSTHLRRLSFSSNYFLGRGGDAEVARGMLAAGGPMCGI